MNFKCNRGNLLKNLELTEVEIFFVIRRFVIHGKIVKWIGQYDTKIYNF